MTVKSIVKDILKILPRDCKFRSVLKEEGGRALFGGVGSFNDYVIPNNVEANNKLNELRTKLFEVMNDQ